MWQMLKALLPGSSTAMSGAGSDRPDPDLGTRSDRPATQREVASLYERPNAFTELLPWTDYDPETRVFLLENGSSVGALFELTPVSSEARSAAYMDALREQIQAAIADTIPEVDHSPWVLQFFVQDDPAISDLAGSVRAYGAERGGGHAFAQTYFAHLDAHVERISRDGGLFVDEQVTGAPWRGQRRRVRACLYRRDAGGELAPEEELNEVAARWVTSLEAAGLHIRRCGAQDLYEWLVPWFNPRPELTAGDPGELLRIAPYPGDEALPFGRDLAEQLTYSMPESDYRAGVWRFDGLPHTVVHTQGLRTTPRVGHFTAERERGDNVYALFDRCPAGTVMAVTITFQPQDSVSNHVAKIKAASGGNNVESQLAYQEAEIAQEQLARGNKLYPTQVAFYLRAPDDRTLVRRRNHLASQLTAQGLHVIPREAELLPLDTYVRNLPMAYDPNLERFTRRSRYMYANHIASLLPLYGRTRGTGHPGMLFYNRGAEPLTFDPLHKQDRKKNAHALILGPTGAGKSAMLNYLIMQMAAIYKPRIFVIEAGNSMGLLGRYAEAHGLSVNQMSLNPGEDVSLPPFSGALALVQGSRSSEIEAAAGDAASLDGAAGDEGEDEDPDEGRDVLGEMELSARIMITGGEAKEDAKMTRADRLAIRRAILRAAENVREAGRCQVLTEDVVEGLRQGARDPSLTHQRAQRIQDMADGMELFCSGFAGKLFNRPGTRWTDVDLTIVDVGMLAREGYEDQLTVAYMGLMNHINDLVEQCQHEDRPTLVITDEGHIITTNPLLAPFVVKITKMWRKLGAWFWIATQNLEDFPDAAKKMLNMMEWWLCLVMPKEEIDQIARFKDLSDEQKTLLLSARKEPGKYIEGVVLTDQIETLFRSVPPPIALSLAMTEKDEKAERRKLMREHGCTEVEAAEWVAQRIAETQTQ
ncbi:conjugative transfer ATPase [Aquisalimonas lutea]|uniref:conjugative transfer ATPase n=1 Tax=Aquisalimonas lutea TaxID=1327750 RepID=UPI0025B47F7C|nr:conjugative transfer ATPase [Aquisalimonas lutea]MDN3519016.1 conjugative transfer ATPase [Aquisalimonas lutea]